jgi:hypothetical protein
MTHATLSLILVICSQVFIGACSLLIFNLVFIFLDDAKEAIKHNLNVLPESKITQIFHGNNKIESWRMIIIMSCCMVLFMYFILKFILYFPNIYISTEYIISTLVAGLGSFIILSSIVDSFKKFGKFGLPLILIGTISIMFGWVYAKSWLTLNLACVAISCACIIAISRLNIKQMAVLCFVIIFFDIYGVWISKDIVTVSNNLITVLPVMLTVPLFPFIPLSPILSAIGLGDIVLSGALITILRKYDLTRWAIIGFIIGLIIVAITLYSFNDTLPATLFLFPTIALCSWIGYKRKQIRV